MRKSLVVFGLMAALCMCQGCGGSPTTETPPSTTTVDANAARNCQLIQSATTQSIALALKTYAAEGHAAEAADIAAKIKTMVETTALPYLNGTSGATSAAVNGFMSGQFITLPSVAQNFISLGAMILDAYLPAPTASAVLDSTQLAYVKAFFNGLDAAASQFSPVGIEQVKTVNKELREVSNGSWFNTMKKQ